MEEIQSEFKRLEAVYDRLEQKLNRQAPATEEEIASIAATTGVEIEENLKSLWRISNGSGRTMWWFAEGDDFTPYYFLSIEDALKTYRASTSHEWDEDEEDWGERDSRIQKHIFCHRSWLSFGAFN